MGAALTRNCHGGGVDGGLGLTSRLSALRVPVSILAFALLTLASCATRRAASFRVLVANPNYLLRSPDAKETPFPDVLAGYTNVGDGWVDLRPGMQLRIENAYYREGTTQRNIANFLGTAIVSYQAGSNGMLRRVAAESTLTRQPADQPPIEQLLPASARNRAHQRFFFQVLINKRSQHRTAVLLSGTVADELDRLTEQLAGKPEFVCGAESMNCTVFPPTSTVSLEIEVVVNGDRRIITWTSQVRSVAVRPKHLELLRLHAGRRTPVDIDLSDPEALRLPLLPGDHINWR